MGTLISQNIPYSGTTLSQQSTPIGAIIPYMGTTAPSGYLACDGTVYAISLYPLLAGFIEAQFGSINYFGGDGTTTFAVPNLQGEFLRGAGTNSHSNQGSGGSVGEHQDATGLLDISLSYDNTDLGIRAGNNRFISNPDSEYKDYSGTLTYNNTRVTKNTTSGQTRDTLTSRPTNTSVLYIIKAKSDRLDKITFAEVDDTSVSSDVVWSAEKTREAVGPESYSTSEQWTGKYWIDGKKIYCITAEITAPTVTTEGTAVTSDINIGITNISRPISITGFWNPDSDNYLPIPYFANVANNQLKCTVLANGKIRVVNMAGGYNGKKGYATVEYTKTTD